MNLKLNFEFSKLGAKVSAIFNPSKCSTFKLGSGKNKSNHGFKSMPTLKT
jgi:hypothetical protein